MQGFWRVDDYDIIKLVEKMKSFYKYVGVFIVEEG